MHSRDARKKRKERQKQLKNSCRGYKLTYADPTPEEAFRLARKREEVEKMNGEFDYAEYFE